MIPTLVATAAFLPRHLLAYSFMVAGLFFPTLGALFWRRVSATAAFWSVLCGGGTTVALTVLGIELPVDPVFPGPALSATVLVAPSRRRVSS